MQPVPPQSFFIVWCPAGHYPPSVRHETLEDASAEAARLAGNNPGKEFFVLAARRRVMVPPAVIVEDFADYDDGIPF